MGSLFSFVVSNRITTPVDLLISIPTNAYIVWRERRSISLKAVIPLSFLLLAGVIPGIYLLKFANDWILRSTLGIVVMGMIIGIKVDSKMNDKMVKNTVITLLIFSGTMLFLKNFFNH